MAKKEKFKGYVNLELCRRCLYWRRINAFDKGFYACHCCLDRGTLRKKDKADSRDCKSFKERKKR